MTKQLMIDPPSGWRYGFPKPMPPEVTDVKKWLVDNGYPQSMIDSLGDNLRCRFWESEE
jgi:hypothetical protein